MKKKLLKKSKRLRKLPPLKLPLLKQQLLKRNKKRFHKLKNKTKSKKKFQRKKKRKHLDFQNLQRKIKKLKMLQLKNQK